jgi:Uma2 family endonuclease
MELDSERHELTQRDLDYTPADGNLWEIIDGELFVTPFPGFAHQRVISRLFETLVVFVRAHQLGEVFTSGLKVVLGEPTGVGPDLVFISAANMKNMRPDGFYGIPELVVEVTSTQPQLDRYVKFRKYEGAGVPHYWIADPRTRTLEVFELTAGKYRRAAELKDEGVFRPSLFPGLELDTSGLWPV